MIDDKQTTDRVVDGPLMDLHDQLVAAIARQHPEVTPLTPPRARRGGSSIVRKVLVAAAAVLVMVGGTLLATSGGDGSKVAADVTVQPTANGVIVSIENNVSVREIAKALRSYDIDVAVKAMTTGPSRIDHFVGVSGSGGKLLGGDGTTTNRASLEKGDHIVLYLGVGADGRPYDASTDAWARGEALAGTNLENTKLADSRAEIERRARASGVTVDYRIMPSAQPIDPLPTDTVVDAAGVAADSVLVVLQR